ncbi:unnamed protein product, partial [Musa acuminata var. zebrina]
TQETTRHGSSRSSSFTATVICVRRDDGRFRPSLFRYTLQLRPPPAPTLTRLGSLHVPAPEGTQQLLLQARRRRRRMAGSVAPTLLHRRHHLPQLLLGHHDLDPDSAALVVSPDDAPRPSLLVHEHPSSSRCWVRRRHLGHLFLP